MREVEDIREIEEPYEGDFDSRPHDFMARITETASGDPEEFMWVVAGHLKEFALQHARDPERLWREWVADFPDSGSLSVSGGSTGRLYRFG